MIDYEWQNRVDGVDDVLADDINYVANKLGEVVDAQNESKPLETPDWNENDETSKAYIKNRTHHDVTRGETTLCDCPSITVVQQDWGEQYDYNYFSADARDFIGSKKYEVNFLGETYFCDARYQGLYAYLLLYKKGEHEWAELNFEGRYGNIVLSYATQTGVYPTKEGAAFTITPIEGELKQLDTKFIPDYVSKTYVDETKCDQEEIKGYVDEALQEAKESGEFDGKDGYTPVRGTDYWTEADKAEIKSYVDEAILGGAW